MAAEALLQYEHLGRLIDGVVTHPETAKTSRTESIDQLMVHRGWGLVIFVGMMYLVFLSVYTWANPFMEAIQAGIKWLQGLTESWFAATPMLQSLMVDGVIEGVGAFLGFLPQIMILFFFIALLEDTGYMARAAFLMDKMFSWCGLNGKSFVPLLSSYACAVPGSHKGHMNLVGHHNASYEVLACNSHMLCHSQYRRDVVVGMRVLGCKISIILVKESYRNRIGEGSLLWGKCPGVVYSKERCPADAFAGHGLRPCDCHSPFVYGSDGYGRIVNQAILDHLPNIVVNL